MKITMPDQPAAAVPKAQLASRRSDGMFIWHKVAIDAEPTFTEPKALWPGGAAVSKEEYETTHRQRQAEHLRNIEQNKRKAWQPCLHDTCSLCLGTGVKADGSPCVHWVSCPCPKCN